MEPKVSIITVCYNSINTIKQTMQSVLAQTYPNVEYIIIDGGSTDGTLDVIKELENENVKWISEPDKGIYDAMNKGIRMASGDWIHFRNCGDYFLSKETLRNVFESNLIPDNIGIVTGDCYFVNNDGYIVETPRVLDVSYRKAMPFHHPATFVRSDIQKEHLFNLKYSSSADYALFFDLLSHSIEYLYIPIVIATFEEGGFSSNYKRAFFQNAEIQGRMNSVFSRLLVNINFCKGQILEKGKSLISNLPLIKDFIFYRRKLNGRVKNPLPIHYDY